MNEILELLRADVNQPYTKSSLRAFDRKARSRLGSLSVNPVLTQEQSRQLATMVLGRSILKATGERFRGKTMFRRSNGSLITKITLGLLVLFMMLADGVLGIARGRVGARRGV